MDKMKSGMMKGKGTSAPQNTAAGSGSKPMGGKYPIKTSAPADQRTLGNRAPRGWLK